ncbi:MAG: TlyA family RNA methyltransferase [Anaerolineae bacterium]|nr:TlyA family RNA methyltransferase [Anaerolineae bacterium]
MKKTRIDLLIFERGLAESRSMAQRLVMAGQVRVGGQIVDKPGAQVASSAEITIDHGPRFVSRGGEKLAAGLEHFAIEVDGKTCADVGASTGGFTDCLLQHGAARVYAIEVGKGILHWKIRQDRRVTVLESTNARYLESLPEPVEMVTVDASFISLKALIPVMKNWLPEKGGEMIALIKPQFEAGRKQVSRGKGVIRDPDVHRSVLTDILEFALQEGFDLQGLIQSPLQGPKGNVEFVAYLTYPGKNTKDAKELVNEVIGGI